MAYKVRRDGGSGGGRLSIDEILEILSNHRRRAVVRFLRDAHGAVHSLDDVISHLREHERRATGESPDRDRLLSLLVHVHGPKLEKAGLVEYDVRSSEIRYHPDERVEQLLERIGAVAEEFDSS